jgi:DNA-binding response OmpR family regulator
MTTDKKVKILLTEDDKFISRAYTDGLTRAGYEVKQAYNGNEALELVKDFKPDLILLDLIMPGKNGFETLGDLKADHELKDIPVIVLSNLGQDTDIQQGKDLGAIDYLIKSNYSLSEVIDKINKHLGREN